MSGLKNGAMTRLNEFPQDEQRKSIIADLATGLTRECACDRAKIARRTFGQWLSRGKKGEEPFATFLAEVKAAEAAIEAEMVHRIRDAAVLNWQAAVWWLERKRMESWHIERQLIRELKKFLRDEKARIAAVEADIASTRDLKRNTVYQ